MTLPPDITYYKVGGFVRDKILGVKSKDIDYAVEAPSYEAMRDDVLARGGKIFVEHPEFFTIRAKLNNEDADFVLCRKEGTYTDGRRPDSVEIGTIDDDLARRDFTVNAIAEREDGTLYDPYHGWLDLQRGVLRCVGVAQHRMAEDTLRMLRAIRFSITKGLVMSYPIQECLTNPMLIDGLSKVSVERIREELNKCLAYDALATIVTLNTFPHMRNVLINHPRISLQIHLKEV